MFLSNAFLIMNKDFELSIHFISLTDNGTFICYPDHLMCDNSTKCIYSVYVCDGHRQCQDGQDENVDECKSRNAFPKQATVQCSEDNRSDKYSIFIMAIPCNGKRECKNGEDKIGCDISFIYLLIFLLMGFAAISVVVGLFDNHHRRAKDFGNIEIEGPKKIKTTLFH